jgi:hypothetical protein
MLTGFLALFAFGGDIVADSLGDACSEHCMSQTSQSGSQNEKAPCSHCSCAVHNGTVIAADNRVHVGADYQASACVRASDQSAPVGLPAAIDHPPQLA